MSSPFDKFAVLILFSAGCSAPHTPHLPKSFVFGASKLDLPYEKLAFTLGGILERRVVFARKKETPQAEDDTGYGIPNNSNPINHPPQLDCVSHRCIRQRNGTIYALMIYFNNLQQFLGCFLCTMPSRHHYHHPPAQACPFTPSRPKLPSLRKPLIHRHRLGHRRRRAWGIAWRERLGTWGG